jgi:predicted GNAT family N-acyltransferase
MTEPPDYRVRLVDWREASGVLAAIRTTVFVGEQKVPPDIEIDGRDGACVHALAETADGTAIGTGRLMPDGRIGRMAVLAAWRGRGVGGAILAALRDEARRLGMRETHLHAQSHARAFYEKHGYRAEGDEYVEAGIPHVLMRCGAGTGFGDGSPEPSPKSHQE